MSGVQLRPIRLDDVDTIMTWIGDPDVTANFATMSKPITREEELVFLAATLASETDRLYAIETPDGEMIGTAGIHKIWWPSRNGRIGLVIGRKDLQGRGLAQQAMRGLCEVAFDDLTLHKLWLVHYRTNTRMRHIAQKLGFVEEGILRDEYFHQGAYHDMVRHSLLEGEYRGTGR